MNFLRVTKSRFCSGKALNPGSRSIGSTGISKASNSKLHRQPGGHRFLSTGQESNSSGRSAALISVAIVPIMFIAWSASDLLLGNRQLDKNEDLRHTFDQQIHDHDKPTLFHCVVRRTLGFTHCLPGAQVGDVVEILQEGVGPNEEYNLCRLPAHPDHPESKDKLGWFPIRWLQKLDDYDRMVQNQLQQLEAEQSK